MNHLLPQSTSKQGHPFITFIIAGVMAVGMFFVLFDLFAAGPKEQLEQDTQKKVDMAMKVGVKQVIGNLNRLSFLSAKRSWEKREEMELWLDSEVGKVRYLYSKKGWYKIERWDWESNLQTTYRFRLIITAAFSTISSQTQLLKMNEKLRGKDENFHTGRWELIIEGREKDSDNSQSHQSISWEKSLPHPHPFNFQSVASPGEIVNYSFPSHPHQPRILSPIAPLVPASFHLASSCPIY